MTGTAVQWLDAPCKRLATHLYPTSLVVTAVSLLTAPMHVVPWVLVLAGINHLIRRSSP